MKKGLIFLVAIAGLLIIGFLLVDEEIPKGEEGKRAEELTDKVFSTLNKEAWDDLLFIRWTFRDSHHYIWDKEQNMAKISWDDYEVFMNLDEIAGRAFKSGKHLEGDKKDEAIAKAWEFWCNDSFWLIAPLKMRDSGTTRKFLKLDDGMDGLLVQYESGGVTPGDAYLWAIDQTGVPRYFKMWVSIIPIGGVKATWSSWKKFEGVLISTEHKMGPLNIPLTDIRAGNTLEEIEADQNLFSQLRN